jgi:TetR/AcrR family transcriptional repressor of nem operon
MGRTSDAKDRLIQAMIELIWTGSFGKTSVDQICERAGVKKGSFYHFFESKGALAETSIAHAWSEHRHLDRLFDCLSNLKSEQEDLFEKHGRVLGCPIHTIGSEVSTTDEALCKLLQDILRQYVRYFESAIRDAHAESLIEAPDAAAKARILFAYSEGLLTHARIWNDLSHLDELETGAREILGLPDRVTIEAA